MARLVDVDKAVKLFRGKCVAKYPSTFSFGLFAAADEVAKMETVDAAPAVHGRWIELSDMEPYFKCSECGRSYAWWEPEEAHYCPNCGARMDLDLVRT